MEIGIRYQVLTLVYQLIEKKSNQLQHTSNDLLNARNVNLYSQAV